jgi:hypothetical protein
MDKQEKSTSNTPSSTSSTRTGLKFDYICIDSAADMVFDAAADMVFDSVSDIKFDSSIMKKFDPAL